MARNALCDRLALVGAIEEAQNPFAQMLIGAVEDDLAIVARAIEAVDRRMDGADVELPAALEEISDLVEQQPRMPAIHRHSLSAESTPFADRRYCGADGAHQRDGEVMDLDGRVYVAGRLIDMNVGQRLRQIPSLRDRRENLPLSLGVQSSDSAKRK